MNAGHWKSGLTVAWFGSYLVNWIERISSKYMLQNVSSSSKPPTEWRFCPYKSHKCNSCAEREHNEKICKSKSGVSKKNVILRLKLKVPQMIEPNPARRGIWSGMRICRRIRKEESSIPNWILLLKQKWKWTILSKGE